MRRKLVCRIAATLPQIIETSGSTASTSTSGRITGAVPNSRSAANRTPALMIVAMNAVTGTLAPSYASGAQPWNGTMAAFRNSEATTSTTPATASVSADPSAEANAAVVIEPLQP